MIQERTVQLPHVNTAVTAGTTVTFTGVSAYDAEIRNAQLAGLVVGTTYTVAGVFTGIGNAAISLTGVKGSFDAQMFNVGAVAVYGLGAATISNAGTGGRFGSYALVLPAPTTGNTQAQAVGYFTVSEWGNLQSITITAAGAGYASAGSSTVALTSAMFAECPGLTGVAGTFACPEVGTASS